MKTFRIGRSKVGEGCPCFIIAEAGINHNGSLDTAKKMIRAAKACGADAVKFQTFKAEEFISDPKEMYSYKTCGKIIRESMYDMFKRYEFSPKVYKVISDYCKKTGITFFSTPQNISDLKILLDIGIPAIKVGSDDLVNLPLIEYYARQGLPVIISTGMAYLKEVEDAVRIVRRHNARLAILHCVSSYPAGFEEMNLARIAVLKSKFPDAIIGFSDHSMGVQASTAAAALGAKIIEKHFTLNKNMKGPDHSFSMDPQELSDLVKAVRNIEKALGTPEISPSKKEQKMRIACYRSLVAARDIRAGERLKASDLFAKRPGTGMLARDINLLINRKTKRAVKKDHMISLKDLS